MICKKMGIMEYALEEFMSMTNDFNEIVYVIDEEPFMPIGVICEDEITPVEKRVADCLKIPILYRDKKIMEYDYCDNEEIEKTYIYTINKLMF